MDESMGCKRLDGKQQMCNRFIEPCYMLPAHTYFFARLNFDMQSFCLCVHLFLQLQCICKFAAVRRSIFDVSLQAVCSSLINSSMCFSGYLQIIFPNFPLLSYLYLYSMFIFYVSRRMCVHSFMFFRYYSLLLHSNKFE